ncbi:MAG TPA: hypothetical protein VFN44_18815 [Solirubrobacteraceae bacterium]|nr:hypothetical protein [Solirubrobacteraceae bacterium]
MTGFRLGAVAGLAAAIAGCGASAPHAARSPAAAPPTSAIAAAQIRADAFATVAARLYGEETAGPAGRANAVRIAHDQGFLRALEAGRPGPIRAATLRELFLPVKHVVRIRVVRAGHTVVDVGGTFVAAAQSVALRAPDGAALGRLDISMQDILGLTKLERRFTGAAIVVRGRPGHVIASDPALTAARPPASGPVRIGGRTYVARSIRRTGFAGEPLEISVLVPLR